MASVLAYASGLWVLDTPHLALRHMLNIAWVAIRASFLHLYTGVAYVWQVALREPLLCRAFQETVNPCL